jgi:putative chitinase
VYGDAGPARLGVIGPTELISIGVGPTQARVFAAPLWVAMKRNDAETIEQQCAFLAQAQHESGDFVHLEENCYYSKVDYIWNAFKRLRSLSKTGLEVLTKNPKGFANVAYAGINGNGNIASGDGWRFRGRGIFQLTGRANYRDAMLALGIDFIRFPDLAAVPENASAIAGWFWKTRGCNQLMLAGDFEGVSEKINGARPANGAADRRKRYAHNLSVLRP